MAVDKTFEDGMMELNALTFEMTNAGFKDDWEATCEGLDKLAEKSQELAKSLRRVHLKETQDSTFAKAIDDAKRISEVLSKMRICHNKRGTDYIIQSVGVDAVTYAHVVSYYPIDSPRVILHRLLPNLLASGRYDIYAHDGTRMPLDEYYNESGAML
jgi:hypothetical protein